MYPAILSTSYQLSSQFSLDPQEPPQQCTFCSGINIIRCMTISVANKHNEEPNFYLNLMDKLVENVKSPLTIKFYDSAIQVADTEEHMTKMYAGKSQKAQTKEMLEYYKFRKFVPLFADLRLGKILHGYYYHRLKLYYNEVKRKLNLTVDPSSSDSFSRTSDLSHSQTFPKSKILDQLTINFKIQETTGPTSIQNFKTQSKALQDLVNFLKTNQKFSKIRPLNVQSEWQKHKKTSKQIFRDIILQQKKKKDFKKNKSKIFITFYSRDGSLKKQSDKKPQLRVLKSQKLAKSKDLKTLNKQKQTKILQKLQKIKNEILDQKLVYIQKGDKEERVKDQVRNEKVESGKKTPLKLLEMPKTAQRRKSLQKLTIDLRNQNLVRQESTAQLTSTIKPRKSHSESKLKPPASISKHRSSKAISTINKPLNTLAANQKSHLPQPQPNQLMINNISKKRPISRRKSLDLTKMKSLLPQTFDSRLDMNLKKEEYLTQRYEKMAMENPNRLMIRTSNVSPVARKELNEQREQIVMEKSDNIVSIKKKKLDMLKKKVEAQRGERK